MEKAESPELFMQAALREAKAALAENEIPVGAVVVREGRIIGRGRNGPIGRIDPTAHAEIAALRAACEEAGNYRLPGADIFVTLEPCIMCAGAMVQARVRRLYFGASDPKGGYRLHDPDLLSSPVLNHRVEVAGGVLEEECGALLKDFFRARRQKQEGA